ncbi:hypothetical protein FRB90_002083 [Tulasnella sp. 427]|nr:hypothetical protein FRB90_002083 [Tulasnella sp. 427]
MAEPSSSIDKLATSLQDLDIDASQAPSKAELKTSELIESLVRLSKTNPKLVKYTPHEVEYTTQKVKQATKTVNSWKMNEYKYSVVPSPFPTLARGLFTETIEEPTGKKKAGLYRVVARGYDKFFNMNEVPWNSWEAIAAHTKAPYHLTVKANGCIIFMSALSPTEVVVMSKHSLGALPGYTVSHAQMGEKWLDRHLERKGKSKTDFAKRLWDENITAVAELCDDSFEEHVLPYSEEETGLHLHGINRNKGDFETFSPEAVQAFAEEWGFIPTDVITLNTPDEVKEFTDKIGETGKWNGKAVEGFVVRTKVCNPSDASAPTKNVAAEGSSTGRDGRRSKSVQNTAPPYPPGSDYFFKIKFDEPYMTYRDWRELTKIMLNARRKETYQSGASIAIPKSKLRRPESLAYRDWVFKEMDRDPALFENFGRGKGIIAVRERFLQWYEGQHGKMAVGASEGIPNPAKSLVNEGEEPKEHWGRAVIVPIAIPGCGKTVVGVALTELFGFGHTQSDNIKSKKTAPEFNRNIAAQLKLHSFVYADRNNHLTQHRSQIREVAKGMRGDPVKTVALYWGFTLPHVTIHRICAERVLNRGENHQSLRGDETKAHEDVIWQFISTSQELAVNEVDHIIDMNIEDTPEEAVTRAAKGLAPLLGLDVPSPERIKAAVDVALQYKASVKKDANAKPAKVSPPRYFGLLAEIDLKEVVPDALESAEAEGIEVPEAIRALWDHLVLTKRVQPRPHITIVHSKGLPADQPLWDRCKHLQTLPVIPSFKFRLAELIANGDVMVAIIEEMEATDEAGQEFLAEMPQEIRQRLHITIGTKSTEIEPYQGKVLVEKWKAGEAGDDAVCLPLNAVKAEGQIRGLQS